jgi:hypothetical protein
MNGTTREMELASFRQRAQEAMKQKAKRSELLMHVPIGYVRAVVGGGLNLSSFSRSERACSS